MLKNTASRCPNLEDIEYGVITVPSYGLGGRAHYVCNKGYKLVGVAYRICQDDCTWNGQPPKCIRMSFNSSTFALISFSFNIHNK